MPELPSFLFHPTSGAALARLRAGEPLAPGGPLHPVWARARERARADHGERATVLIVEIARLAAPPRPDAADPEAPLRAPAIPPEAVLDLDPELREEVCAGGVLVRHDGRSRVETALVLVERRDGARRWELPKGHLEADESPEQAAVREVREELGLDPAVSLTIAAALGESHHAFRKKGGRGAPRFKTTHWFLLRSDPRELAFRPQRAEGVIEVAWADLDAAPGRVGHANLRAPLRAAARAAHGGEAAP